MILRLLALIIALRFCFLLLFPALQSDDDGADTNKYKQSKYVVVRDTIWIHFPFSLGDVSRDGPTNLWPKRPKGLSVVDEVKFLIITAALIIGRYHARKETAPHGYDLILHRRPRLPSNQPASEPRHNMCRPTDASKQTTPPLSIADRQSKHPAVPDRHISLLPLSFRRFSGICRISDTCSENKSPTEQLHALPAPTGPGKTNEALTSYYGPPPGPPKLLQRLSTPSGSSPLLIHGNNQTQKNEWSTRRRSEKLRVRARQKRDRATRQNNTRRHSTCGEQRSDGGRTTPFVIVEPGQTESKEPVFG